MINLDKTDLKILYEISENARETKNKISKKLKISREVLEYRIKKLQKQNVITGFQARINISNFVYGGYIFLIQSTGLNGESEQKVIRKLEQNNKIQYVGKLGGQYDFIIGLTIKKLSELSEIIDEINLIFGKNKTDQTILTMAKEIKDSFKTLFSRTDESNNIISMPLVNDKIKIDSIDKKILVSLGKDCNMASWKIADKVKLSEVAVRKRIQNLVKNKVILNFRTMIDLTKINYQLYFLFIKINPMNLQSKTEMTEFSNKDQRVIYSTKVAGKYDYVITISLENNGELKNIIYELREKFPNLIREIDISPLFEIAYHAQLAENFLE